MRILLIKYTPQSSKAVMATQEKNKQTNMTVIRPLDPTTMNRNQNRTE